MNFSFSLRRDTVSPDIRRVVYEMKRGAPLLQAAGKAIVRETKLHLKKLQARGNRKGWPSKKFFAGGLNSVDKRVGVSQLTAQQVTVSIADPRFVHRVQGGPVSAKRKKYLAIPLTAEAYRRSGNGSLQTAWPELQLFVFPRGMFLGLRRAAGQKGAQFTLHFKLVRSVTHAPKPGEAPDTGALGLAAINAMENVATRIVNQSRR